MYSLLSSTLCTLRRKCHSVFVSVCLMCIVNSQSISLSFHDSHIKMMAFNRFHSLHHTQFRTNYSLFMPFYDYIYGTMDKSSDNLYESCLMGRQEEALDVVHLTHLTTLQSIYHLRLGFASLSSKPYESKWYMWVMSPLSWGWMMLTWVYGTTFTVERNRLKKLNMETWAIPRYNFQVRHCYTIFFFQFKVLRSKLYS